MPDTSYSQDIPSIAKSARYCLWPADVAEHKRVAFWQEGISRELKAEVEPDRHSPFKVGAEVLSVGHCNLFSVLSSRASYSVEKKNLPEAPDMISFIVMRQGRAYGRQRDREVTIEAGQATVMLANELHSLHVLDDEATFNVFRLPIATVAPFVPDLSKALLRPMTHEQTAVKLLETYGNSLLDAERAFEPTLSAIAASHITDLVNNALSSLAAPAERSEWLGVRTARRQAIKADIARNLTSHDLTPVATARRLGITPRYLRKLLQEEGTSFSDIVRSLRLQLAHRQLSDPLRFRETVTSIAYFVGYNDLSHFNRCFREQFGMTPTEVRDQVLRKL